MEAHPARSSPRDPRMVLLPGRGARRLSLVLRRLAGAVQRVARGLPEEPAAPERPWSDYEKKRLARYLDRLSTGELEILTCWADSNYSESEVATLLQIVPGEVQRLLGS